MPQNESQEKAGSLLALAEARFRRKAAPQTSPNFTAAERTLLAKAPLGEFAYCGPNSNPKDPNNQPNKAEKSKGNPGWGPDREIDASLLRWLCVDRAAKDQVDPVGIQIQAAIITGGLDLNYVAVLFPIRFWNCALAEDAELDQVEIPRLDLSGSWAKSISADGAIIKGYVFLNEGFHADGGVQLSNAQIGGNLDCVGGTFCNPSGYAIIADGAVVKGSVFLSQGFHAYGGVRLLGVQIADTLECEGGTFETPKGYALYADHAEVNGYIFLRGNFKGLGEVNLRGAKIGANLECDGGTFDNRQGKALDADGLIVKGDVFLRNGFHANGLVRLLGAQIDGDLDCSAGTFQNPGGYALAADDVIVKGEAHLRDGFYADGDVRLSGAQIGADLNCGHGTFNGRLGNALEVDGAVVKGALSMHGMRAYGQVNLVGAQIGGNLACNGCALDNPRGYALQADRIHVNGDVILSQGFMAHGEVRLLGAQIGGNLDCDGGTFDNPGDKSKALNIEHADVKRDVFLRHGFRARGAVYMLDTSVEGELDLIRGNFEGASLDLRDASASSLWDDAKSWPPPGKLHLDGFVYGRIAGGPTTADARLEWLGLQPGFATEPYLQLAKVLREAGDNDGAAQVLMAMEDEQRRGDILRPVLKWSIGYGQHPLWAGGWALGLSALGWVLYRRSYLAGSMVPTEKDACGDFKRDGQTPFRYETFSPLVYSVENSLPLVKLGQADKWEPDSDPNASRSRKRRWIKSASRENPWPGPFQLLERLLIFVGLLAPIGLEQPPSGFSRWGTSPRFLRWFLWAQILLGWLLATLFLAGVTGIVRKD